MLQKLNVSPNFASWSWGEGAVIVTPDHTLNKGLDKVQLLRGQS